MRDVGELVTGEHLAPYAIGPDVLARVRRRRPKIDDWMVDEGPRRAIGNGERVVDDDMRLPGRCVADDPRHGGIDRFHSLGDRARPLLELQRIVEGEPRSLDGAPVQPGAHDELRGGRPRQAKGNAGENRQREAPKLEADYRSRERFSLSISHDEGRMNKGVRTNPSSVFTQIS